MSDRLSPCVLSLVRVLFCVAGLGHGPFHLYGLSLLVPGFCGFCRCGALQRLSRRSCFWTTFAAGFEDKALDVESLLAWLDKMVGHISRFIAENRATLSMTQVLQVHEETTRWIASFRSQRRLLRSFAWHKRIPDHGPGVGQAGADALADIWRKLDVSLT